MLAAGYPRLAGSDDPGGASTSNRKTFAFGPLKAGATPKLVWKLSAVKAGDFTVLYRVGAGLGGRRQGEDRPAASLPAAPSSTEITEPTPDTEVNDSGEVVEKSKQRQRSQPGE